METIKGVPVTEEMIASWAREAEQGYDVEQLRAHGRRPASHEQVQVVPVALDEKTLSAVDKRAAAEHMDRSAYIRAAIRAYVA